ncbi:DUF4097 family beta strand repeat protein [Mucilaginibacter mali]|uniref:DUF4097 family beta strand repeat protein n=1 Tax=Mucilaginibacter mali TaxID=2740462 RepID=A0A7D4QQ39_9SPHI|nr:DUF4097 family beta strand repeat-containing protein [Mucilaginibacter mali]QKJ28929.1 DUF4097 family beta strand repeat protein [Mucilaginibacter mali]
MKALKFTGLVALALALSTRLMAQESQQLTVPLSDPGKPYKLNVDLVTGSIKVSVHDGKDIIIDASAPHGRKEAKESGGMRRLSSGENLDVEAREKNNQVRISNNMPNKNVALDIKIPRGATNIKLMAVNGGDISVNDVSSDIEASNTNGAIKLTNISGSAVANTTNGRVLVTFKTLDNKAALAFTTLNGDVDVTFPATFKANLKARSDNGNVFSDFDMVTEKSPSKSTKTAKDGMYRITIEDWVYGKINGGGPELLMKNMNGNIYIRKAK